MGKRSDMRPSFTDDVCRRLAQLGLFITICVVGCWSWPFRWNRGRGGWAIPAIPRGQFTVEFTVKFLRQEGQGGGTERATEQATENTDATNNV